MNFGNNQSYNRNDFAGPGLGQEDEQQYAQMQGGYQQNMYGNMGQPQYAGMNQGGDMYQQNQM